MSTTASRSTSSSPPRDRPWHLGNTTVRSPFRLADALRVLADSTFNGDWSDPHAEAGFGALLHKRGFLRSVAEGETAAWNGRKWRSAMYQLGFITPELVRGLPGGQVDIRIQQIAAGMRGITGRQYEVTPNGIRLANATSVIEMEECFLRALLAYRVPSPIERGTHRCEPFSPLRVVLATMLALEADSLDSRISFEEMASLVQFCKSETDVPRLVTEISTYRRARESAPNKRVFDDDFRRRENERHGNPVTLDSLRDYADVNFRYLRAAGLITRGRASISMTAEKRDEVQRIMLEHDEWPGDDAYLRRLWDGASLPTDDVNEAIAAIRELQRELREGGRTVSFSPIVGVPVADLAQIRLGLEAERRFMREDMFARSQRSDIGTISELIALMQSKTERATAFRSEAPAYLEWTLWRAFLAINTLTNKPWEVRQFAVDSEMNPLSHASSRRPDIICEFDDYVLVVEVTFTENSRQEAVEGEPVRRHVADVALRYAGVKPVYGLFIAPRIDTNTAETFGHGNFVVAQKRVPLSIVPMTLEQFGAMFRHGFKSSPGIGPDDVRSFLDAAIALRSDDGEAWKAAVEGLLRDSLAATEHTTEGGRR
jgi:hypothetical protein